MNIYKAFGLRKKQAHVSSVDPDRLGGKLTRAEKLLRDREEARVAEIIRSKASLSPTINEAYEMRDIDRWKQSMLKKPFSPKPKPQDEDRDSYNDLRDLGD